MPLIEQNGKHVIDQMRYLLLFVLILFSLSFFGCYNGPDVANGLPGTHWGRRSGDIQRTLHFSDDKTWVSEIKTVAKPFKPSINVGYLSGSWHADKNKLKLTPIEISGDVDWEKGIVKIFEVIEISEALLTIKTDSGSTETWYRSHEVSASDKTTTSTIDIKTGPITVNLQKNQSSKNRYLTVEITAILDRDGEQPYLFQKTVKSADGGNDPSTEQKIYLFHPKIRESLIYYLSSLQYSDIDRPNKLKKPENEIFNLINPYVKMRLDSIKIDNIVATGKTNKIDLQLETADHVESDTINQDN